MLYQSAHDARAGTPLRKLAAIVGVVIQLYEKAAWRANAVLSVQIGRLRGQTSNLSRAFSALPLVLGKVSPSTVANVKNSVLSAPLIKFDASDHAAGYVFQSDAAAISRVFEGGYRFRQFDMPQLRAVAHFLSEVEPAVTERLGSGWKVINLKSWSTRSDTVQQGPNAWHLDGFPIGTFKLMIYLTPVGPATGSTEVRFADGSSKVLEGEAGTYLLFDPSVLWHRGVAPLGAGVERTHVEITIMRALSTDLRPVEGGLNSSFPRVPWTPRPIRVA
jgi:hypothetical protein